MKDLLKDLSNKNSFFNLLQLLRGPTNYPQISFTCDSILFKKFKNIIPKNKHHQR